MSMKKIAAIAAAVVALGTSAAWAGDPVKGKEAFKVNGCFECHGYEGQGANTGPRLAPDPLPLDAMKSFVRNSSGPMPPFREKILSDAALDDIHAYLASIPKTQDWKTIKLLQD